MIVVSNTTPLNYLILTESVHVLPALFGRVYVPSAVLGELSHAKSPGPVRAFAAPPLSLLKRCSKNPSDGIGSESSSGIGSESSSTSWSSSGRRFDGSATR